MHLLQLKKLVVFLESLRTYIFEWKESIAKIKNPDDQVQTFTVSGLIQQLGRKVVSVNLLEIEAYLRSSKVSVFILLVIVLTNTANQIAGKISSYFNQITRPAAETCKCEGL
jgi:predicted signal transduction protein with EAL and GGDEF domain